jgi:hypothetical protein
MKNRYGVEYTFVKYDDKLYRFNMSVMDRGAEGLFVEVEL